MSTVLVLYLGIRRTFASLKAAQQ